MVQLGLKTDSCTSFFNICYFLD